MRSRKNKNLPPTVCYRCKKCQACFITMAEINHHLHKYNHFIRPSDEESNSAPAFPPLPLPALPARGVGMASSPADTGGEGDRGSRRRSTQNGNRNNDIEGETNNNGVGNHNRSGSRKSSVDASTSPLKSYAESVKKKENTGKPRPETEKSSSMMNLTEQNDIEDNMETDTDTPQSTMNNEKQWPLVTSKVDVTMMETEPIFESLSQSNDVLSNSKMLTTSVAPAHSPKKTSAAPATASSSLILDLSNQSSENGAQQKSNAGIEVSSKGDGEDIVPAKTPVAALPLKKPNGGTRVMERRRTGPSAADPVTRSSRSGSEQSESSKKVEKVNKKGESLSATLSTMTAKLNHMKWRDVPTTAFTYSNQTQKSTSAENEGKPAATGKYKRRFKCKYCDERFMYPVQIISHVRRDHKSISRTADSKFPVSTNKTKKAEQDEEDPPASSATTTTAATKSGQSYPLRSLYTRGRRSTTEVNYTVDKKEKKSQRKPSKFTCKHCSQKFAILAHLKQHLHSRHPETIARLNPDGVPTKKRKLKRFRFSIKRKTQQGSSTPASATSPSIVSEEPAATVPNIIPESKPKEVDEQHTSIVEEANIQSQPKPRKRTMFTCKHCDKKFPLLNQLKIHLHQEHPEIMGNKKQTKIALNGDEKPVVTDSPKASVPRSQKRQLRLSKKQEEPVRKKSREEEPIMRNSTEGLSSDITLQDVKPDLTELKQTIVLSAKKATNEVITIEDEPDDFVDTAETILAALTSRRSQTCPCCMKFFKFAGSLKNHLKVCTDEYLAKNDRRQLEDAETVKINIEDDEDEEGDNDESLMEEEGDNNDESLEDEEGDNGESLEEEGDNDEDLEEEEAEAQENYKIETDHEISREDNQLDFDDPNTVPYYRQLDYCRCWLCEVVVARFYNLKRHLVQVHKLKMTTNEIHTKQTQLLGVPSPRIKSKK